MFFLAKYGVQTTFYFPMIKRAVFDLAVTGDWTPATGDTKVSKDAGAQANTTNNPAISTGVTWKLTLTATEMQAADIQVMVVDSATKAVEDQWINIYTYGHASAKIQADLSDSVRLGLTALPNAAAEAAGGLYTRGTGAGQINQDANGRVDANTKAWIGGTIPAVNVTGVPKTDVVDWLGSAPNVLQSGRVDSYIGAVASGVIAAASFAANALAAVWDELRSGHVVVGTFGQGNQNLTSGTATAGGTATITLKVGSSASDSYYNNLIVVITAGTGKGQVRTIASYVGATRVATVDANWDTTPDNTSQYAIIGH